MTDIDAATYWLGLIHAAKITGAFLVAVGVAAEFLGDWVAAPYEKVIEEGRKAETRKLTKEILDAQEATAKATERAAEAQLALEKFKAARSLSPAQMKDVAQRMSRWKTLPANGRTQVVSVFNIDPSFESAGLADQIAEALGPNGAGFDVGRNHATGGLKYELINVLGVAMLASSNPRGRAVADDLAKALNANGISASIIADRRFGCEDSGQSAIADTEPSCSGVSVIVGEKPRQ